MIDMTRYFFFYHKNPDIKDDNIIICVDDNCGPVDFDGTVYRGPANGEDTKALFEHEEVYHATSS